ncbi:unnamed protein product [Amoebophrya sp. A120]|nr:unnamed protein product [Amoebophrya sp. A120]|eukprot:GSA120T00000635001.1
MELLHVGHHMSLFATSFFYGGGGGGQGGINNNYDWQHAYFSGQEDLAVHDLRHDASSTTSSHSSSSSSSTSRYNARQLASTTAGTAAPLLTEADESLRLRVQILLFFTFIAAGVGVYRTKYASLTEAARVTSTAVEKNFKFTYLGAYLLAMLADWLQGPYVYALYAAYGFSHEDNSRLFIFGFGSSMLFGTFIGGYADKHGRKKFAILYCIVYALSCCTKHFNSFFMLSVGRILAGVATSLLYSVFESWVVCEHAQRAFSDDVLGDIFSLAIFGNSCVAISAGFLAQWVSDLMPFTKVTEVFYIGQYTNPFDFAIVILLLCAGWVHTQWCENYGSSSLAATTSSENKDLESVPQDDNALTLEEQGLAAPGSESNGDKSDFEKAWQLLKEDRKIQSVALMSGFFESSMFIFVFLWTPAILKADNGDIQTPPFGLIFAVFMLGCMTGSCFFSHVTTPTEAGGWGWDIHRCAFFLFAGSAASHAIVVFSQSSFAILSAFVLFEVCVGMYFPSMGLLKSKVVPESCRSTLYNFFRVPLNFIVCCVLLSNVPVKLGFIFTTALLFCCIYLLYRMGDVEGITSAGSPLEAGEATQKEQIIGNADLEEGNPIAGG